MYMTYIERILKDQGPAMHRQVSYIFLRKSKKIRKVQVQDMKSARVSAKRLMPRHLELSWLFPASPTTPPLLAVPRPAAPALQGARPVPPAPRRPPRCSRRCRCRAWWIRRLGWKGFWKLKIWKIPSPLLVNWANMSKTSQITYKQSSCHISLNRLRERKKNYSVLPNIAQLY